MKLFWFITLFLLFACSSTKENVQFDHVDTNIEKTFSDKALDKFKTEDAIDTTKIVKSVDPKKIEETPKTVVDKKPIIKKTDEVKKQPTKVIEKSSKKKKTQISNKTKDDYLKKVKKIVKEDREEIKEKEFPIPNNYPKKFLGYDKKSKVVWDLHRPKVFVDESHVFEISYLGITVGTIKMETKPLVKVANEPSVHYKVLLQSADYYNYIYKLNDTLESFVSVRDFLPLKYKLVQRESSQEVDDLQIFDHEKRKTFFWYRKLKEGKEKKDKKEKFTPQFFQDSFSSLQFTRGLPLKLGEEYEFPIVTRTKVWIAKMEVVNTLDKIEVNNKTYDAIKIKAETHYPGVMKKKGKITFWFSNDENRRLLKFEGKIKIGSVKGHLIDYKPGKALVY